MTESHPNVPAPVAIALVVCDNVDQSSSGKRALVGLFDRISAVRFPAVHPRLCVYVSITDVRRFTHCKLDIVHGETDKPIVVSQGPMPEEGGPIAVWALVFELEGLQFPEPGTYFVRFFGNDQILVQRPIEVIELQRGGEKNG